MIAANLNPMPTARQTPSHWLRALLALGLSVCLLMFILVAVNRSFDTVDYERSGARQTAPLAGDTLRVMIWNLGYGGLGAESDFVSDGGDHVLPPNRTTVVKNISGIRRFLDRADADAILLQEVAGASFLTRGQSIRSGLDADFSDRDNAFSADFNIRWLPRHFAPRHGLYSSLGFAGADRRITPLPKEPGYMAGLTRRLYHAQIIRAPYASGEWAIINVHLSAFDDGADVRQAQLDAVLALAEAEYADGRHVVIGGDWNFEFANPGRETTTSADDLFWLHPFPAAKLKPGWKAVFDLATPTVRTNERPYRAGENYTTIIDGFVVSPNVDILAIETADLDFEFSDHQPVMARFRATDF